ncbi:hypothetical protein [Anoxynatronum sibiricum]|uniref:hypothetical protein n=1 Tax=Anoxynatronum sibiricum TaxID=210623 RepID=UPI0031B853A3
MDSLAGNLQAIFACGREAGSLITTTKAKECPHEKKGNPLQQTDMAGNAGRDVMDAAGNNAGIG